MRFFQNKEGEGQMCRIYSSHPSRTLSIDFFVFFPAMFGASAQGAVIHQLCIKEMSMHTQIPPLHPSLAQAGNALLQLLTQSLWMLCGNTFDIIAAAMESKVSLRPPKSCNNHLSVDVMEKFTCICISDIKRWKKSKSRSDNALQVLEKDPATMRKPTIRDDELN